MRGVRYKNVTGTENHADDCACPFCNGSSGPGLSAHKDDCECPVCTGENKEAKNQHSEACECRFCTGGGGTEYHSNDCGCPLCTGEGGPGTNAHPRDCECSFCGPGEFQHDDDCTCGWCMASDSRREVVDETGHRVSSSWEKEIDLYLHASGREYVYEPGPFVFEDGRKYTPDFMVGDTVIEVKGRIHSDWEIERAKLFMQEYKEYNYMVIGNPEIPADESVRWENRQFIEEIL